MKKILVFAIVTLFCISVFAETVFEYNGVYYKKTSSTTACVIANPDGTKYSGDITIPYAVPYIGKRGTITFTVTSIADNAFYNCTELTSIDLPTSISVIGMGSFCDCKELESVDISNVTTIDGYAFYRCVSLKSINIPNVITIGEMAFYGCTFDTIDLPKVETIGELAFHSCKNLRSINMPKVKTLEGGAFRACNFTSLNLPATLDSIGKYALSNSGLKYITIDEANENFAVRDNVLYDKDFTKLIQYPIGQEAKSISVLNTVTTIGGGAFGQCESVERVDMPNVNIIESGAFSWCIDLKSVNMPKVTAIETSVFLQCKNLNSINIPNVTKIESSAFYSCSNLQKVVLGNKVNSIEDEAFMECASLDTFRIITAMPPILGNDVFKYTPSNVLIQVPCGASSLYEQVKVWKDFANYEELVPKVTVLSNDEKMGLVILDRQATCENPTAEIEAMPRSGYEFVKWSDESTENPRVVTVEDEDITLIAIFQKVGTDVENVGIEGVTIYSDGTVLHVEGAEKEYQIYSTTGSLLYCGTDAEVALPRGIYVVRYGNAIEKVVL